MQKNIIKCPFCFQKLYLFPHKIDYIYYDDYVWAACDNHFPISFEMILCSNHNIEIIYYAFPYKDYNVFVYDYFSKNETNILCNGKLISNIKIKQLSIDNVIEKVSTIMNFS